MHPTLAPTPLATPAPAVVAASVLGSVLALLGLVGALYMRKMMMDKKKMMKIAVGDGSGMQPVEIPPEVGRLPYLRSSTLPSLIYLRIL